MDLFRRIFGKPNEEFPEDEAIESSSDSESDSSNNDNKASDSVAEGVTAELDAATHPVSPYSRASIAEGVTQPLNSEVLVSSNQGHLTFGQSTDVGLVRNNNQDSALSLFFTSDSVDEHPDLGLFVVADGMGGHLEGEKASAITTRTVAAQLVSKVYMPMISGIGSSDIPPISEALIEAVQESNAEVIRQVPDGGTTVTAVAIVGDLAYLAHVGDSRAYIVTSSGIEQVTRDHSLVQRLIELDQLTPEEAETHQQKNVLYRALGQNESLEVDTMTRRLPGSSRLLICSDGLWGQVEEKDLREITMSHEDPQVACEKLVALANTHGGVDNITAIILKLS